MQELDEAGVFWPVKNKWKWNKIFLWKKCCPYFSSPRSKRFFMTATNSLLLNWPSIFSSKIVKTTSMTWSERSTKATVLATCFKVVWSIDAPVKIFLSRHPTTSRRWKLTSNVIKCERSVDVVDVVQKVEEIQIIFFGDALAVIPEPLLDALNLLHLLFLRITGVGKQKFRKVGFGDVAIVIRVLPHEL